MNGAKRTTMEMTQIKDPNNKLQCIFCKSTELDEINLGPMYCCEDVVTHYYCMLFSAGLVQKGSTDKEGILGFLPPDIWKEVRRGNRLKCTFCNQNGASIGCCKKSCKTMCHFRCGLENGVQYQFYKNFMTYCIDHHVPQHIDIPEDEWKCPICLTLIEKEENPIMPTCCKGTVFHKQCVKRMALNAGYFFKCPMCNDTKGFIKEMRLYGVFVPEQDASWEREPHAFQDHYHQYSTCDAEICKCSKGRNFDAEEGEFEIARCNVCGASAVHLKCGKLKNADDWNCDACSNVIKNAGLTKSSPYSSCTTTSQNSSLTEREPNVAAVGENFRDTVNLSQIKLMRPAKNYFPYIQGQLRKFQNKGVQMLPDWRGLVLQVNVVNWLGTYAQKIEDINDPFRFNNANFLRKADHPSAVRIRRSPPHTSLSTRGRDVNQISDDTSARRKGASGKHKTKSKSPRGKGNRGANGKYKKTTSAQRPGPPVATLRDKSPFKTTTINHFFNKSNPVCKDTDMEKQNKPLFEGNKLQPAASATSPSFAVPDQWRKVFERGQDVHASVVVRDKSHFESHKLQPAASATSTSFAVPVPVPVPVQRHKIFELGQDVYAADVVRDIFVQNNGVVNNAVDVVPQIDIGVSSLQECTEKKETRCNGNLGHLEQTNGVDGMSEDVTMETDHDMSEDVTMETDHNTNDEVVPEASATTEEVIMEASATTEEVIMEASATTEEVIMEASATTEEVITEASATTEEIQV